MRTVRLTNILFLIFFVCISCARNAEFDPGPFAPGGKGDKTLQTFHVSDASGNPIEGAYVVSYRQLAPKYIRVGEGYTDHIGQIKLEDATHTVKGYATVVAPGYNSKRVELNIEQQKENTISITLAPQDVLKVMSYNIEEGFKNNATLKADFAKWVATYDPDIVLLQEMMHFNDATFAAFAKTYGHDYAVLSKTTGIPTAITSKEPITDIRKVIQVGVLHHGYVTGVVSGVRVFAAHLCPYAVDNDRNIYNIDRVDEIKIIMEDADRYANVPVIIGADLNSRNAFDLDRFGPTYRYANQDFTVTNLLKENNYYDTYPLLNNLFKSSHPVESISTNGANEGSRIDYQYVNQHAKGSVVFSDIIQSAYTDKYSDHYPTYIEIKK